jgi:hypothetical protein
VDQLAKIPLRRQAKMGVCRCGAAIWYGVDADVAALTVVLDRPPLKATHVEAGGYIIRLNTIHYTTTARPLDLWERTYQVHECEAR